MNISADERLAFALINSPGTYALLLGSGTSRAAGIPTGWEITLDLVSQIAKIKGVESAVMSDPEAWYCTEFGKVPDYSDIIAMLDSTGSERQNRLERYIEPDEANSEEGRKQPTDAHRAIAKLAKRGMIRVIVTTNFDQLIESALMDEGVPLAVISSPDDIEGMTPLTQSHGQCSVIKIHGDYKDNRILNTPDELKEYDERVNHLLDQIFDEFGIIVCGWSAEWDVALRSAILRCNSRRYSWYWAEHGATVEAAEKVIQHRGAQRIPIQGADDFFAGLQNRSEALLQYQRPHPDSTTLAVAALKRYMMPPDPQIRLADLIREKTEQAASVIRANEDARPHNWPKQTEASEAACETLIAMAATAGYWMQDEQLRYWTESLETLLLATLPWASLSNVMQRVLPHGDTIDYILGKVHMYPASLIFWSICTGAMLSGNFNVIARLMYQKLRTSRRQTPEITGMDLYPPGWQESSNQIYGQMQNALTKAMPYFTHNDIGRYHLHIDKFDMVWHLANAFAVAQKTPADIQELQRRYVSGELRIQSSGENARQIINELMREINFPQDNSLLANSGLFGRSMDESQGIINFIVECNRFRIQYY